jgi:hypothetical protein
VEQAVPVDPPGESDEGVRGREDQHDGERVLPERHADQSRPRRKHHRGCQREESQDVREHAVRVGGDCDVAREVRGEERVRHRLSRRLRVLLPRGERTRSGVRDRVEGEAKREPRHHERDAAAERRGSVEPAGGEQNGCRTGDDGELRQAEEADPDHLPSEQVAGPDRGQDQLDDAIVLFLDHAGDDPLPVHRQRGEQEDRREIGGRGLGARRLLVHRFERRRRQLRRRRQVVPERAHGAFGHRGGGPVYLRSKDELVLREQ